MREISPHTVVARFGHLLFLRFVRSLYSPASVRGNIIALFCPFSPPLDLSRSAGRPEPFGQRVGLLRAGFLRDMNMGAVHGKSWMHPPPEVQQAWPISPRPMLARTVEDTLSHFSLLCHGKPKQELRRVRCIVRRRERSC